MQSVGKVIRARREQLGLSQQALAELSGVAASTIRNIESDRVDEARTWRQVELVLGWGPRSLDALRRGSQPESLLPEDALRIASHALLKLQETADIRGQAAAQATARMRKIHEELMSAHTQHAANPGEESERQVQALESEAASAASADAAASDSGHAIRGVSHRFRKNYLEILEDLAQGWDIAADRPASRTYSFLRGLALAVRPYELEVVLNALAAVITPSGWTRLAKLDKAGVLKPWLHQREHEAMDSAVAARQGSVGDARPSSENKLLEEVANATEVITGEVDQVMIPIMVDKKELDGLDNDDLVSVVNLLTLEARHMLQLLVNTKRRARASRAFEATSEWPSLNIGKEGDTP